MVVRGQNGHIVHIHNIDHLSQHADVIPLLQEAVDLLGPLDGRRFHTATVDFQRIVGKQARVETGPDDDIYFQVRPNRCWPTRFVRGRQATPCQHVTLVLKQLKRQDHFVLVTAFVGTQSMREPGDPSLRDAVSRAEAEAFWANNALIDESN